MADSESIIPLIETPDVAHTKLQNLWYKNRTLRDTYSLRRQWDESTALVNKWRLAAVYNKSKLSINYLQSAASRGIDQLEKSLLWTMLHA